MLITCGSCGNDVSDKALRCPKCKTPVRPLAISCPECSKDIAAGDLDSECPHCGYPLKHLRLSGSAQEAPAQPAAPPPPSRPAPKKPASVECPNCGLALRQDMAGGMECPDCGYGMRPEKAASAKEASASKPSKQAAPPRKEAAPKSRIRIAAECLGIVLVVCAVSFGALFLALRFDVLGMRTSLKSAAFAEETSDSIKGGFSDARLWVKHVLSVVLDQFPDEVRPSGNGVEGERR